MSAAFDEITCQLKEAAEPVLTEVRAKLFDAADHERSAEQRLASLVQAEIACRMLLRQIEHSWKETK